MLLVERELMAKTACQTAQAAGALLLAVADQDSTAIETAAIRTRLLAQMNGLDAWTEEKAELLEAVATAFEQGTAGLGALKLLAHVARGAGSSTQVM